MGFWDWLSGKLKPVEAADVIWLTPNARRGGVLAALQQELDRAPLVLALAHFPATLVRLAEDCDGAALPHFFHQATLTAGDLARLARTGPARILLTLAETLAPEPTPADVDAAAAALPIIVVERHFLRAHDDQVCRFAAGLGRQCRVSFHLSLGDPLMRRFSGDWVQGVLARLGMKESDALESPMVARRVKAAQDQFARLVTHEQSAEGPEEWLRLNVPE